MQAFMILSSFEGTRTMGQILSWRSSTTGLLVAASCGMVAAANAQQAPVSAAKHVHDGLYAVEISTLRGGCDKALHWKIIVTEGRVSSPADAFMQASGSIDGK